MKFCFYIDLITDDEKDLYLSETIENDEPIKYGNEYPIEDHVDIRGQVKDALSPLAAKIRNYNKDLIKYAHNSMSDPKIKRGLSSYVDFGFNTPDGLTDEEIKKFYRWSIRFSEHEDKHGEDKNRYYVELEGRTLNSLSKVGWRKFKSKLPKIQKKIRDFEIKKFGEQKTFIIDEKPEEQNNNTNITTESFKLTIAESPFTPFRRSNWNPESIGEDFDDIILSLKDRNKISAWCDYSDDIMWFIKSGKAKYEFYASVNDCDKVKLLTWLQKKKPKTREETIKLTSDYIKKYC